MVVIGGHIDVIFQNMEEQRGWGLGRLFQQIQSFAKGAHFQLRLVVIYDRYAYFK